MRYKLIVSDFDGTLRHTDGHIPEENSRAVQDYVRAGGKFVLCTGRMPSSIVPRARELGLTGPVVSYQGAMITDIGTGKIYRNEVLPNADAQRICRHLQKNGLHIHVYDGNIFYLNTDDLFRVYYEEICGVTGILTSSDIAATVREKGICPQKIVVMCAPSDRDAILKDLVSSYGDAYYITSSTDTLVEVAAKGTNKGGALRFLAEYYGIDPAETIGIGDNYNDIPLIEAAGLGVAVGNAVQALKDRADFITGNCDENGAGYVIRKFGLEEEI